MKRKLIQTIPQPSPVSAAKLAVCDRVGCNVYGRTEVFLSAVEAGDNAAARMHLLDLLRFFPAARS